MEDDWCFHIALDDTRAIQGDPQQHPLTPGIAGNVDRNRRRIVRRQGEWRAVTEGAEGAGQRHFSLVQRGLIDSQGMKSPRVSYALPEPGVDIARDVAILLLEMLRLKEHALSPDHFVVPGHRNTMVKLKRLSVNVLHSPETSG